jgi:proteasome lid subunit RPN8/RPN11
MNDFTQPSSSSIPLPNFAGTTASRAAKAVGTRLVLCPGHRSRLEHLAEISYPFEACGVLAGALQPKDLDPDDVIVQAVWSARNVGSRVRDRFRLDPEDFLAADRQARARGMQIVGIWHSHPNKPPVPSPLDLAEAWEAYSYLILGIDPRGRVDFRSWRRGAGADRAMHEETIVWRPEGGGP